MREMPYPMLREWRIHFILDDSDANPELTKWDTPETAQAKIAAKKAQQAAEAIKNPRGR